MSKINELFQSTPESLQSRIEQYIKSTKDFTDEIQSFKTLVSDPNYEKALLVFYVELLSKAIKKPADFNAFISILIPFIDNVISMKTSILILRCLKALCYSKFFVPVSFYLTKLMSMAMNIKNLKKIGQQMNYDHVRVSSDETESEELQMFVIKECLVLIKRHCHTFGNSIGFPEFATVVCNELKSQCKVGIYKEIAVDLIKYISKRKSYIEEQRNRLNVNAVDANKISEFENQLEAWIAE
ncbi:uncharacterized protein VICG_01669 [Vittaforma corneae ATCC 50505]|uniref:Uncharacterized protein n=1 Tax=Vittaforma corneae (strain ATCC 50505) TaxID=993615 RepID=L2GKC1_VITCO|nr:uncharacterized protein VICG_01669 [Vittaforma corneae ATCC 50505]ELA41296.1 hypothetical protein VICG_01669 [Vittaforma corneae ATCC 50505]